MRYAIAVALAGTSLSGTALAAPILWSTSAGGNGHYYEFIQAGVNWDTALAAAQASANLGQSGYLATVTSANEQAFIFASVTNQLAWIGGSDRQSEGVWRWESGPEAGQTFSGLGAPAGAYSNWGQGEPNDCCSGEDYLQFAWLGDGSWNDHGGPGNAGQSNGYLIEYNAPPAQTPVPSTLALIGAACLLGCMRRHLPR